METTTKNSARFVFKGMVPQTQAATLQSITDTRRTTIVHVDEIVRAPDALLDHAGQDIAVHLAEDECARKGQQAVLYAAGMTFGENLGVQSPGHESLPRSRAAAAHHEIRQHAAAAGLVIRGKVNCGRGSGCGHGL